MGKRNEVDAEPTEETEPTAAEMLAYARSVLDAIEARAPKNGRLVSAVARVRFGLATLEKVLTWAGVE